ncbi:hypothetical protein EZV62_008939 [Acer yangbiense]|uniref:Leucine-rich repeat-containing N-terminal plant-type domain-containing protein n=1 Tax=Acer yangbiense TaxID=1000413 RepID=A0A5C7IF98_9ROSI|nr:hypothetical protein EZV62_008939 [Acer yangbiense]
MVGRLMWCYQLFFLQLVLLHSPSCANLCSQDESSALLCFKQLFSFSNSSSSFCSGLQPDYPKMKYWKEDTNCCSWEGVTCDRVTGHVISLDLSCSWLHGTISSNSSLFLLSHLQKLNLAYNFFDLSQIPSDFIRFPSLTHLNLTSSSFSGQVPLEISHLSKLISLDLSSNDLTLETLVMKGETNGLVNAVLSTCLPPTCSLALSFANLCSHEQSSALLQFKQLFSFHNHSSSDCDYVGIPSYPKMMYWKDDIDCCSWDGVTCDWPESQL